MESSMNSGERVMGTSGHPTDPAAVAGKVRVYEVAKEFGLANKDALAKLRSFGIEVKNHMSSVDAEDVARLKRALDKERHANLVEQRVTSTVIRPRSKDGSQLRPAAGPAAATPSSRPAEEQPRAVEARKAEPELNRPEPQLRPDADPRKPEHVNETG